MILLGRKLCCAIVSILLGTVACVETIAAEPPSTEEILARFDVEATDWRVRMRSLVDLAKVGEGAVGELVAALATGSPNQQEFAAHALSVLQVPAARSALERALKNRSASVRAYAVRALSMIGGADVSTATAKQLKPKKYSTAALARKTAPADAKLWQTTLTGFDVASIDSAAVGRPAPDFRLTSLAGEPIWLKQFRGQIVVLEFNGAHD